MPPPYPPYRFPLDRLAMEVQAVTETSYPPNDIAEWSRIVFTTLERVFPEHQSRTEF
jgi:hypothetical protein